MNERRSGRFSEVVEGHQRRSAPILVALVALAAIAALSACGGGDDEDEPGATTPAGETAAPDRFASDATASPTAATTLPEITSLCDLVPVEDVEEALGESVTGSTEFKDVACGYSTTGGSVNIEGFPQSGFEVSELGEPVAGIGDEAAWLIGALNILSVRQGDFYFQIRLGPGGPGEHTAAQLEAAKDMATKAVERIP